MIPGPSVAAVNWTMIGVALAFLVQFAGGVSFAATAQARLDKLEESTRPLRDGDLVRIQTDVAWIRERMSKEDRE